MFLWTIPPNGDLKVDVFLFKDHEEKIKWVLHDMNIYLTNIVLHWVIHLFTKNHYIGIKTPKCEIFQKPKYSEKEQKQR
jgi:hypothetical protein